MNKYHKHLIESNILYYYWKELNKDFKRKFKWHCIAFAERRVQFTMVPFKHLSKYSLVMFTWNAWLSSCIRILSLKLLSCLLVLLSSAAIYIIIYGDIVWVRTTNFSIANLCFPVPAFPLFVEDDIWWLHFVTFCNIFCNI